MSELRRLAKAATPGTWTTAPGKVSGYPFLLCGGKALFTPATGCGRKEGAANAAFIAAANPTKVVALLDKIKALVVEVERLKAAPLKFAQAILHGSDEHRAWLTDAAQCFVQGRELPRSRG